MTRQSLHSFNGLYQYLIDRVEPNQTYSWVLKIQNDINRNADEENEDDEVDQAGAARHAVCHQQRRCEYGDTEHYEYHKRRMSLECDRALGRNVDHFIYAGQDKHHHCRATGSLTGTDNLPPNCILDLLRFRKLRIDGGDIWNFLVDSKARAPVTAEVFPQLRLRIRRKQIQSQIRGPNCIRLLRDKVS